MFKHIFGRKTPKQAIPKKKTSALTEMARKIRAEEYVYGFGREEERESAELLGELEEARRKTRFEQRKADIETDWDVYYDWAVDDDI